MSVRVTSGGPRARECASRPAPTGGAGAQDGDCSAHVTRQSLRITDGPPERELEPEGEGTRRLPHESTKY
eukprot:scaffold26275_cov31-Tisochrysis_lutea.AAC.10